MERRNPARAPLYQTKKYKDLVGRLAANVRRLREARGWTQEVAAGKARGMETVHYRAVETQRANFTAVTVARLCEAFGVDVLELFAPAEPPAKRGRGRPRSE